MYLEFKGNIFNSLNNGWQEPLFLAFKIILTIHFWILNIKLLYVKLLQNTIPYDIM
jgi:hypothetical protein